MKKYFFILVLVNQIFISSGNAKDWLTISIGTGKLKETEYIGGNYFMSFRMSYILVDENKESYVSPFIKAGAYMGFETMKMRALDARNFSRNLNISSFDVGAIWNPLGFKYLFFRMGYAAPLSAELEGTGEGYGAGFIYGGILGSIHKDSIVIEYGVDKYYASGITFGDVNKNNIREIDFDIRIRVSIHYILSSK